MTSLHLFGIGFATRSAGGVRGLAFANASRVGKTRRRNGRACRPGPKMRDEPADCVDSRTNLALLERVGHLAQVGLPARIPLLLVRGRRCELLSTASRARFQLPFARTEITSAASPASTFSSFPPGKCQPFGTHFHDFAPSLPSSTLYPRFAATGINSRR